jgi:hypothetical protein
MSNEGSVVVCDTLLLARGAILTKQKGNPQRRRGQNPTDGITVSTDVYTHVGVSSCVGRMQTDDKITERPSQTLNVKRKSVNRDFDIQVEEETDIGRKEEDDIGLNELDFGDSTVRLTGEGER